MARSRSTTCAAESPETAGPRRTRAAACCSAPADVDLPDVFKALGHPARLEILQALAACDTACCGDLVKRLPLAQSTVSQHLAVLRAAGLVGMRGDGRCCRYHLEPGALTRLTGDVERLFASFLRQPAPAPHLSDRMAPARPRKDTE
ncbi:ArsR/SmtB family transcription factor [Stappia sp.]|uniref:ArsR/SmtB family transcription factor n=1 Tax=Stappia sp. TaxID=1870903 RepID=UPI003C7B1189